MKGSRLYWLLLLLVGGQVVATPGDTDTSFGLNGEYVGTLNGRVTHWQDIVIDDQGNLALVGRARDGYCVITKRLATGFRDQSFNPSAAESDEVGFVFFRPPLGGFNALNGGCERIVLQRDGSLLAAGWVQTDQASTPEDSDTGIYYLIEVNANGSAGDLNGTGNYVFELSQQTGGTRHARVTDLLLQDDHLAIVALRSGFIRDSAFVETNEAGIFIGGLSANTAIDTRFGANGYTALGHGLVARNQRSFGRTYFAFGDQLRWSIIGDENAPSPNAALLAGEYDALVRLPDTGVVAFGFSDLFTVSSQQIESTLSAGKWLAPDQLDPSFTFRSSNEPLDQKTGMSLIDDDLRGGWNAAFGLFEQELYRASAAVSANGFLIHTTPVSTFTPVGGSLSPAGKLVPAIAARSADGMPDANFGLRGTGVRFYGRAVDAAYEAVAITANGDIVAAGWEFDGSIYTPVLTRIDGPNGSGAAWDLLPDVLNPQTRIDVARNTLISSAEIAVSGLGLGLEVPAFVGGDASSEVSVNSGPWTGHTALVRNGDRIRVRHRSAGADFTAVNTHLQIGGLRAENNYANHIGGGNQVVSFDFDTLTGSALPGVKCSDSGGSNCPGSLFDSSLLSTFSSDIALFADCAYITRIDVGIDLMHSQIGDLSADLVYFGDQTVSVPLFDNLTENNNGITACPRQDMLATFSQQGEVPIETACVSEPLSSQQPGINGDFRPASSLNALLGAGNGPLNPVSFMSFRLIVREAGGPASGSLNDWSIDLTCSNTPPGLADVRTEVNSITAVDAGETITYSFSVVNDGPLTASNVQFNGAVGSSQINGLGYFSEFQWSCAGNGAASCTLPSRCQNAAVCDPTFFAPLMSIPAGDRVDIDLIGKVDPFLYEPGSADYQLVDGEANLLLAIGGASDPDVNNNDAAVSKVILGQRATVRLGDANVLQTDDVISVFFNASNSGPSLDRGRRLSVEVPINYRLRPASKVVCTRADGGACNGEFVRRSGSGPEVYDLTGMTIAPSPEATRHVSLDLIYAGPTAPQGQVQVLLAQMPGSPTLDTLPTDTLSIPVGASINRAPTPSDDLIVVDQGGTATQLSNGATSLLDNDSDPDGDPLTATLGGMPQHGQVQLSSDGRFVYQHDGSQNLSDNFGYLACDTRSPAQCTAVTAFVQVNAINQTPVAAIDQIIVGRGGQTRVLQTGATSVLDNDLDADGDTLSIRPVLLVAPMHGTLTIASTGTFIYTHDNSATMSDTAGYEVCDDGSPQRCTSGDVEIRIETVNPIAINDAFQTFINTPINGTVAGNDSDPNANTLTYTQVKMPTAGTATIDANGNFSYQPNSGFEGTDGFTYEVSNGTGTARARVTIDVVVNPNELIFRNSF